MRFAFLLASLACFVIGLAIGWDLIDLDATEVHEIRATVAWSAQGAALYVASLLIGERP